MLFASRVRLVTTVAVLAGLLPPLNGDARGQGTSFDVVIRDTANPRLTLFFSSTTGDYRFAECGKSTSLSGRGTLTRLGCKVGLKHIGPDPKRPDRNVDAEANTCTHAAFANVTINSPFASYRLNDADTRDNDLVPPQVTVNAPNGGERYGVGVPLAIRWTVLDGTTVDVLTSGDGGASFSVVASGLAATAGQFSWTPPASAESSAARVRVVASDAVCNSASDDSDASFSIINDQTPPSVTVTAPNGGETVNTGAEVVIAWSASDAGGLVSHDIHLSTDGGASFSTVATGLGPGVRQYTWRVPEVHNTSSARIRVTARDIGANLGADLSDAGFTIVNDVTAPAVTLVSPNGGEILHAGGRYTITWSAIDNKGLASYDLLYSADGGGSYSPIAAGLGAAVTQRSWTVPLALRNRNTVRVRVVARDREGNTARDDSDADVLAWDPGTSYAYAATAPFHLSARGVASRVQLHAARGPISGEIAVRKPLGSGARPKFPVTFQLGAGELRTFQASDLVEVPAGLAGDPPLVSGAIVVRYNAPTPSALTGIVDVTLGDERAFAVPFVEADCVASNGSFDLRAPLVLIDGQHETTVVLHNQSDAPAAGTLKAFGISESGAVVSTSMAVALEGQATSLVKLRDVLGNPAEPTWAALEVVTSCGALAAYALSEGADTDLVLPAAFSPPRFSSASRVAGPIVLDRTAASVGYVLVTNLSPTTTSGTVRLQSDSAPLSQTSFSFTLGPRQQRLIRLDPGALLPVGGRAQVAAVVEWVGDPNALAAGAVTLAADRARALPTLEAEPGAPETQVQVCPLSVVDPVTSAEVLVTNLGPGRVQVGVSMRFADPAATHVESPSVSVGPGETRSLDLGTQLNQVPPGAAGVLELRQTPGRVVASFSAVGREGATSRARSALFRPVPVTVTAPAIFPAAEIEPNQPIGVVVIMPPDGGPPQLVSPIGTVTPLPGHPDDPDGVGHFEIVVPEDDFDEETVVLTALSPSGVGTSQVTLQKIKLRSIATSQGGQDTGGRLDMEAPTSFVLRGKKPFDLPAGVGLEVAFEQDSQRAVASNVALDPADTNKKTLTGTAPANPGFIGPVTIVVYAVEPDGTRVRISKDKTGGADEEGNVISGAYYAFAPPTSITGVNPDGHNRLGGLITIRGSGFKKFGSLLPEGNIGGRIDLEVIAVNDAGTEVSARVLRAADSVDSCLVAGEVPCKVIVLKNPGGRSQDKLRSAKLYNLKAGPPPNVESISRVSGASTGGTDVIARGQNMDFVKAITINGRGASIESKTESEVRFEVPANCAATFPIRFEDVDTTRTDFGTFTYLPTLTGLNLLDGEEFTVGLGRRFTTGDFPLTVGPCETLEFDGATDGAAGPNNCLQAGVRRRLVVRTDDSARYAVFLVIDASACNTIQAVGTYHFNFRLRNGSISEPVQVDIVVQ